MYPLKPFSEVVPAGSEVSFVMAALFVCIVCALETVLSAQVASVRAGDHPFSEQQELGAVTISHLVQGITGTLPNTGLFLRTSANVMSGATHRMSNFINVVLLGIIAIAISKQFSYLPQPSAAAILASGSIRMVPYSYLGRLWRVDKMRLSLTAVVTLVSCFRDPVEGLIAGIFIAYMANATMIVEGHGVCDVKHLQDGQGYEIIINGPLTYITGKQVERTMKKCRGATTVVVRMRAVAQVDTDGVVAVEHGLRHLTVGDSPSQVYFCSVREAVERKMRAAHGLAKFERVPEHRKDLEVEFVRRKSKLSNSIPVAEVTTDGSTEDQPANAATTAEAPKLTKDGRQIIAL